MPAELIAIAAKAMAAQPEERYASMQALREDLERYQSGLAVSAYSYSLVQWLSRWFRRNRRALLIWGTVGAVILALVAALYGERLKEVATWGAPALVEDFLDDSWTRRWLTVEGQFERQGGEIVGTGGGGNDLLLDRRFSGATAIEYDACIPPHSHPGDISLIWNRGYHRDPSGQVVLERPIEVKIGAFDDTFSGIYDDRSIRAWSSFRPEVGRTYHFRVEIVDCQITVWVDGRQLCSYQHPFPLTGGYLSLYSYYAGKAFSHLRIFERRAPQLLPATALGDLLAERGEYLDAAEQYARVIDSQRGTAISEEALYRQGLCLYEGGKQAQAFQRWAGLTDRGLKEQAELHRLLARQDGGDVPGLLAAITTTYPGASEAGRVVLIGMWNNACDAAVRRQDQVACSALVELHDRLFPEAAISDFSCADALAKLGRDQEIIDRYPGLLFPRTGAQTRLCLFDDLLHDYADYPERCEAALFLSGRFTELLTRYPDNGFKYEALINAGRFSEADKLPAPRDLRALQLLMSGRIEEAVAPPVCYWQQIALLGQGHYDQVSMPEAKLYALLLERDFARVVAEAPNSDQADYARMCQAVDAAIAGNRDPLRTYTGRVQLPHVGPSEREHLLLLFITRAILDLTEHSHTLDELSRAFLTTQAGHWMECQAGYYCAELLTGRIDVAAFRAQPFQLAMAGDTELMAGLVADLAGRADEALAHYRAWTTLPFWQRDRHAVDCIPADFTAWRIAVLSRPAH